MSVTHKHSWTLSLKIAVAVTASFTPEVGFSCQFGVQILNLGSKNLVPVLYIRFGDFREVSDVRTT